MQQMGHVAKPMAIAKELFCTQGFFCTFLGFIIRKKLLLASIPLLEQLVSMLLQQSLNLIYDVHLMLSDFMAGAQTGTQTCKHDVTITLNIRHSSFACVSHTVDDKQM